MSENVQHVEIVRPLDERPNAVREIVVRNADDLEFLREYATALSVSRLFDERGGSAMTPAKAAVKVLAGQELGIGPISAMMNIHVIDGKVVLSANLMAATIKRHELYDYRVLEHDDQACTVVILGREIVEETVGSVSRRHTDWVEIGRETYSMTDADRARLGWRRDAKPGDPRDANSPWVKHPRSMLFARALSNAARWYTPDVFYGLPVYVEGEIDAGAELTEEQAESYFHGTEEQATAVVDDVTSRMDPTAEQEHHLEGDNATADQPPITGSPIDIVERQRIVNEGLDKIRAEKIARDAKAENAQRALTAAEVDPDAPRPGDDIAPDERAVTNTQLRRLGVLAGQLGFTDLQRHDEAGVTSWNHLTYASADVVIKDWTGRLLAAKGGRQT